MIKGLIFDFDGLILDTETPEFVVWQEIFQGYGQNLPINEWQAAVGASFASFEPVAYLASKIDRPLDRDAIHAVHRQRSLEIIQRQPTQPGVVEFLREASQSHLRLGIASSSPTQWVIPFLKRLELEKYFSKVVCKDHVTNIKPHPELFLRCAAELGVEKHEAIIFEDSPNGICAAAAAGIFCVAVPNALTRQMDLSQADLILDRIDQLPLEKLLLLADHQPLS